MGARGDRARGGGGAAHEHGSRRHHRRLRPGADPRGGRRGRGAGDRLGRGRRAAATWSRASPRAAPRPSSPPRSSTTATHSIAEAKAAMREAGIEVRLGPGRRRGALRPALVRFGPDGDRRAPVGIDRDRRSGGVAAGMREVLDRCRGGERRERPLLDPRRCAPSERCQTTCAVPLGRRRPAVTSRRAPARTASSRVPVPPVGDTRPPGPQVAPVQARPDRDAVAARRPRSPAGSRSAPPPRGS